MWKPFEGAMAPLAALCLILFPSIILAESTGDEDTSVVVDGMTFSSWSEFTGSSYFEAANHRCHTPDRATRLMLHGGVPKATENPDCGAASTNPRGIYEPGTVYDLKVVVHILMDDACSRGAISDSRVRSQIAILNEDFQALSGSNGSSGYRSGIRFALADRDPSGRPTTGITRTCNTQYFNDNGNYWNQLAWDPSRYINIYTNNGGGGLGYVPFLPADGSPGAKSDRVVVAHETFGRNAPGGAPYHLGRTTTHEVGHFLGLEHTFNGSCGNASAPACYRNGDLICDTNAERDPVYSPCHLGASSSCGSTDPSDNYMDYSDDSCMKRFSREQVRRMRCSIENYRSGLVSTSNPPPPPPTGDCVPDNTTLCLTGGRFRVKVDWRAQGGANGSASVAPAGTDDSGLFYFFDASNWEMLVKVLDACAVNQRFWVFAAATTNLGYTLEVTDMDTGRTKTYSNPLGTASPAVTDANAFATCQ